MIFTFLKLFIFRTFLKNKNVENLLSIQANSEISVLHFYPIIGLTAAVYSCFQLSLWLAGPII